MSAKIISGTEVAAQIREELKKEVDELKEKTGVVPGLVTILVGHNPASVSYVTAKQKTAHDLGFHSIQDDQPEDISEENLLRLIDKYNTDPKIHGILVQLPLPKHIDEKKVLNAIDPDKDVDGFHPVNVGRLMIGGNIVGKPIANIMLQKGKGANSTVTIVHTGTRNLEAHCKRADILIVAAGVPGLVKPEWIKPGACVIDVGVNRVGEKMSEKTGKMVPILKGDVDFDAAKEIAGAITPVPGGVGPMTITMLMKNTVKSAKLSAGLQ